MRDWLTIVFSISVLFANHAAYGCGNAVILPKLESGKDMLIFSLLELSLSKTKEEFCFRPIDEVISDARKTRDIAKGLMSIKWASAASMAEDELSPVRIPIFKGLLGYRIFVIRQGEQQRYDSIETLDQLKKLTAGQGAFWGDTRVLKNANIPVVTSIQARNLWKMLDNKRFDYLPLAVHEPWDDLEMRSELQLTVEKNIMLHYPSAMYFYVRKENESLFRSITKGMKQAIADGSYDRLLYQSKMIQSAIQYANLKHRKILAIPNPSFHAKTPPEYLAYWISPAILVDEVNSLAQ